ncbi:alpha-ketoglutarate-dependent taurine dioxygenase [Streptomyces sp. SAI-144]|uniref:TauD/TfdA family dioxygenase n=1 Tax=Streptomyces sp. SAI-144 TaxID=2940544 RepID=UPI002473188F|nr:TauD/TfdA family dioxygenase [Streptomyces sp. SAI-144]MDH6439008.1 alpha-ketoglutarate-dependent taurine dioxygenase [Streptomyces sp. SAI-144]
MSSMNLLPNLDLAPDSPPILHAKSGEDPAGWAAEHHDTLRALVLEHGGVLVRGLGLSDPATTEAVFRRLTSGLMPDREPFAPRRSYGGGVYSTTKWPPNQQMCMHHEVSYGLEFPGLLLFACLEAPGAGGATALADASAVLRDLPRELVSRFERVGWLLTRSYHEEIGASVEEAFGTDDRAAVERYCRRHAIEFAWQSDGSLHTRQRRGAVLRHPDSGLPCWFNQIAFLNEWTMEPEVHEYLVDMYGADGLPFNTRFGDGDPIDVDVVRTINEVYDAHTVREPWQDGDLLLVDNIRTAHSREPFEGPREVLAALGNPVSRTDGEVSGV